MSRKLTWLLVGSCALIALAGLYALGGSRTAADHRFVGSWKATSGHWIRDLTLRENGTATLLYRKDYTTTGTRIELQGNYSTGATPDSIDVTWSRAGPDGDHMVMVLSPGGNLVYAAGGASIEFFGIVSSVTR